MNETAFINLLSFTTNLHQPKFNFQTDNYIDAPIRSTEVVNAYEILKDPRTRTSYLHFAETWNTFTTDHSANLANRSERISRALSLISATTDYKRSSNTKEPAPEQVDAFLKAGLAWEQQLTELPREVLESASFQKSIRSLPEQIWKLNNPSLLSRITALNSSAIELTENEQFRDLMFESVANYTRNHPIDESTIHGFEEQLFPRMALRDPELTLLLAAGNRWGMGKGDFGVNDFLIHTTITEVSPLRINERMLIAASIPTLDEHHFRQNRLDALTLAPSFGILRDFIHDQRPNVHELLQAMVHYYDTNDRSQLETAIPNATYFNNEERKAMLFDRAGYERLVEQEGHDQYIEQIQQQAQHGTNLSKNTMPVPAIEILRRLVTNTKPIPYKPPLLDDPELDPLIKQSTEDTASLTRLIDAINTRLTDSIERKEIGLTPTFVQLLNWIDHRGFKLIQQLSFEKQRGIVHSPTLQSLIRFHELTASPEKYDSTEVDSFLTRLQREDDLTASQMLAQRITTQISGLTKHYRATSNLDPGALWSGNLTHELMTLGDLRPAATPIGERYKRDALLGRKQNESGYHPGD
jgi:hypothetical protein